MSSAEAEGNDEAGPEEPEQEPSGPELDFAHYSDNHGAELEDTDADTALLGGDYCDTRETKDPYELAEMVDDTFSTASENYEDVKAIPGNHELELGPSVDELYDDLTDEEGEFEDDSDSLYEHLTGNEGEDPEDADTLFDLVVNQYDNVEDVSYSSFEIDGHTVVAGGSHHDPEIPKKVYDLLEDDPEMDELGYDDEKLEEVADMMEGEEDYGFWGNLPYVGDFFKKVGEFLGFYGTEDIDPEELGLEDIPEEERTEAHQEYLDQIEEIEEEYGDQIEAMEEKKETLQNLIDEAENPVIAFDHGIPMTDDAGKELDYVEKVGAYKGSVVWKELLQENEVEAFLGGHFHGQMDEEAYDIRLLNPGTGYQEVALEDGLEVEQYELEAGGLEEGGAPEQERPSLIEVAQEKPEEAHQMIDQKVEMLERAMNREDFNEEEQQALQQEIEKHEMAHEDIDRIAEGEIEPPTPGAPATPESPGEDGSAEEAAA